MTVNISKPALNLREELAALRNQGGAYEESKFYLDGLVTNGTFNSDISGWTASASTLSIDTARLLVSVASGSGYAYQDISVVVGKSYVVSGTVTAVSGTVNFRIGSGGTTLTYYNAGWGVAGTLTQTVVATSTTLSVCVGVDGTTSSVLFDNVSVYETDGTNLIHSTPNGYSIKDVYIDGVLAREGSAYDYTVHDGYIKPTIAPTATTETCLIGVRT